MSTKIYTGFKFTNDLFEIHNEIMKFRHELKIKVDEKITDYFAKECSVLLDSISVGARKLKKRDTIYGIIWKDFSEKEREIEQGKRNPAVDFSFGISIIPTKDRKILGIVYTEQQEFLNMWTAKSFVEDYSYWNNTDKPDNISEEEWKERSETWNNILEDFLGVPSMLGFTADCVQKYGMTPIIENVISKFPSFEERSSRIAEDVLFEEICRKDKIDASNAVKIYSEFLKWIKSDEGRLIKAKKQGVFEYKMIRNVRKEDL